MRLTERCELDDMDDENNLKHYPMDDRIFSKSREGILLSGAILDLNV